MKYLVILLTLLTYRAEAQSEEERVKAVINALFEGMRRSDSAALKAVFAPAAILQTIAAKEGKVSVRTDGVANFITSVSKPQGAVLDERISFGQVLVDGALASVWTPYKFYVGDKFSHCGVNSFQLVKIDGSWKIQYVIDTRRKEGCN